MVSKFWQPGLASRKGRRTILLNGNVIALPPSNVSTRGNSDVEVRPSPIAIRQTVGPVARSSQPKKKNGGKMLLGLGRHNRKAVLTFEKKPAVSAVDMDPKERVETLLKKHQDYLYNRGNVNQWEAVEHVRRVYPHLLIPRRNQREFGSIPGIQVNDTFKSRATMALVGLHGHSQAGIDYTEYIDPKDGRGMLVAVSIVVSGVYEDDVDDGEELIYTGQGGNELQGSRRQVKDQSLEGGNLALYHSCQLQFSVRVTRARPSDARNPSSHTVYSYDGLYKVCLCGPEIGISGFKVYKYHMVREPNQPPLEWFRNQVNM